MAIHVVVDGAALRADKASTGSVFASQVSREGERHLVEKLVRPVVVFDLDAVIGMNSRAAELSISVTQRVFAHTVVVGDKRQPRLRPIQDLPTQPGLAAIAAIGLPAVDDPGFNLQLVGRKPLDADAVEEPRGIRRYIGRLVGPVVEVVVTEKTDVRNENARVDIEPVVYVEVIAAVGLRDVLVGAA